MWEPRPLTTLWAFTACYKDTFTFIGNSIDSVSIRNLPGPEVGDVAISRLFYTDDLTVTSLTVNDLQETIDQVYKYCKEWSLKCDISESKIIFF
jgi:hypothetical protein